MIYGCRKNHRRAPEIGNRKNEKPVLLFTPPLCHCEKSVSFTGAKTRRIPAVYHIGLNLTAVMLLVRGAAQVPELSSGMDAAISGIAGIGHMLLAAGMVFLLVQIRRSAAAA